MNFIISQPRSLHHSIFFLIYLPLHAQPHLPAIERSCFTIELHCSQSSLVTSGMPFSRFKVIPIDFFLTRNLRFTDVTAKESRRNSMKFIPYLNLHYLLLFLFRKKIHLCITLASSFLTLGLLYEKLN